MPPVATTAGHPTSVCPVPAHLRPPIVYSRSQRCLIAAQKPHLPRLMPGAYLRPVPDRRR